MGGSAPWPGVQEGDEARLGAALAGVEPRLEDPSALAGRMAPGGDRFAGEAPRLPAASWALRLGEAWGVPSPEALAAAVGLLCLSPPEGDALSWLPAVSSLLGAAHPPDLGLHLAAEAGRLPPTRWPGGRVVADVAGGMERTVGREIPLALLAPAAAVGADLDPLRGPARDIAHAVTLFAAMDRLWRDRAYSDLARGALTPALAPALSTPAGAAALLDALAGAASTDGLLARSQKVLLSPGVWVLTRRAWAQTLGDARRAAQAFGPAPVQGALDALLHALADAWDRLEGELRFHALALDLVPDPPAVGALRLPAVGAALAALGADPLLREAWEIQLRDLGRVRAPLVGRLFPRALIASQLLAHPVGRRLAGEVLAEAAASLRYYEGCPDIPPDADSLGVLLTLAGAGVGPAPHAAGWLRVMEASLGADGITMTWFERGPDGPTTPDPSLRWGGADCAAVRLSLMKGLLAWDGEGHRARVGLNVQRALDRLDAASAALGGCFHYPEAFGVGLLLQIASAVRARGWSGPWEDRLLGDAAILSRALLGRQRLDGSWGGPQETALIAGPLATWGAPREPIDRAARALIEAQRGDGAWDAEPLWVTFGHPGTQARYQSRSMTSALVAGALLAMEPGGRAAADQPSRRA